MRDRRLDHLFVQGRYAFGFAARGTNAGRYRPGFAPEQAASLAVAYQLGKRTRLRSAVWLASGRRTTPITDDVGWDTRDAFSGSREVSGSPAHTLGALDGTRLPPYLRVDLGIRRTVPLPRSRGTLTGFASLDNALGRENVAAFVIPGGTGARRDLVMLPLSAILGLEWRY